MMIEKYAIWQRTRQGAYTLSEYNDNSMHMLCMLLDDGIVAETYIEFLQNKDIKSFGGNLIIILKKGDIVHVTIDDPDSIDLQYFKTTIENLIKIVFKWNYYVGNFVDTIKIILKHDDVMIYGGQKDNIAYNPQKLIFAFDEKYKSYSTLTCEGESSYLLSYLLVSLLPRDIDSYIQWALNPIEDYILVSFSILEKKDGFIFIGLKVGESDVGAHYKISIENFVELLKKWQIFERIGEPKIIVHEKDGNVVLEAYHE